MTIRENDLLLGPLILMPMGLGPATRDFGWVGTESRGWPRYKALVSATETTAILKPNPANLVGTWRPAFQDGTTADVSTRQ